MNRIELKCVVYRLFFISASPSILRDRNLFVTVHRGFSSFVDCAIFPLFCSSLVRDLPFIRSISHFPGLSVRVDVGASPPIAFFLGDCISNDYGRRQTILKPQRRKETISHPSFYRDYGCLCSAVGFVNLIFTD